MDLGYTNAPVETYHWDRRCKMDTRKIDRLGCLIDMDTLSLRLRATVTRRSEACRNVRLNKSFAFITESG